ncbi:MAG: double-strand break repair protein AddB, partial [Alphaproteobacteria bacterium]|nr:double-strand break repair protein AddB [Alphaproteobacteria bacterium]
MFTVAAGAPFLHTVANALLHGDLPRTGSVAPDALTLPDTTVILPTPRAVRAMQTAFLSAAGGTALLLPRIVPITEDEDDLALLSALDDTTGLGADGVATLPPAMDDIERKVTLTRLVLRWSEAMARSASQMSGAHLSDHAVKVGRETPAQAAHLAGELAQLMDMVEREGASLEGLADLVPEALSEHWQATLEFLKIVTEIWPQHLHDQGLSAKVARRNAAILAEAKRLQTTSPDAPVIIAGVTGSVPATAELMRVVTGLPNGAIVLPGLDLTLDEESWQAIAPNDNANSGHPEHPQYGLKRLLDTLNVTRQDIALVGNVEPTSAHGHRQRFVSEALRPATTTKAWREFADAVDKQDLEAGLEGVHVIETPNAQDEAEAIALIMREAAETPGRTAALVSPDRILARRVGVRLESWGIRVDDSAGRPFVKTAPGTFLDLVIEAIASDFAPKDVVALLKHPLTRLELDPFTIRKSARALEIAAFRDLYLGRGLSGVDDALVRAKTDVETKRHRHRAVERIWEDDWTGAQQIIERLKEAYAPLEPYYTSGGAHADLKQMIGAHLKAAEAIARHPTEEASADPSSKDVHNSSSEPRDADPSDPENEEPASPLWTGASGEQGSLFFSKLLSSGAPEFAVTAADYPELYRSLLVGLNTRERGPVHP